MADKEKRILITQWNINYDICLAPTEYQCGTSKSCDDCKVGMNRQEAIERMAKALKKVIYILSEEACIEGCEAALNALLEVKK